MESFFGTWKVVIQKTTGVAEIGKAFGWTEEKSQMFATLDYTMLVEANGDDLRGVLDYGSIKMEFKFKLGEEFDYQGVDGTGAKCKVVMDGDKWVEYYRIPEKAEATWTTTREIINGEQVAVTIFDASPDLKCIQTLVKV